MRRSDLTFLQFNLLAVIDSGAHEGVTFEEVKDAIRAGSLFRWMQSRFGDRVDVSLFDPQHRPGIDREVIAALTGALDAIDGREGRKVGITRNGVCLLAALITEAIQQGKMKAD